ncbi:ATP-binding cassette domain-containing protein [Paenibacillus thiaminolyticus]|nr:ATP-binding cassette domain-containing protein [Paenibacillus thiaminolyticus]
MPERFDISFRQVRFGYEQRQVLRGIDFVAEHGKVTALVGPSGAGKSTAAQLIARFYEVTDGSIQIGGHRYSLHSAAAIDGHDLLRVPGRPGGE